MAQTFLCVGEEALAKKVFNGKTDGYDDSKDHERRSWRESIGISYHEVKKRSHVKALREYDQVNQKVWLNDGLVMELTVFSGWLTKELGERKRIKRSILINTKKAINSLECSLQESLKMDQDEMWGFNVQQVHHDNVKWKRRKTHPLIAYAILKGKQIGCRQPCGVTLEHNEQY